MRCHHQNAVKLANGHSHFALSIGDVMRVLIVEDEQKVAEDIARALNASGFVCDIVADGEEAWFRGDTEDYSAIILDLGLPKLDGISVLKRWRGANVVTPVLILTARGSWSERVEGIDAGADDYLAKPFHVEELIARLRAVLRRSMGRAISEIKVGDLSLDPRQMRLSQNGTPLQLSSLEYRTIAYLLHHRGRVVSQQEMVEHIYGEGADKDTNTLEVLIGRVRRKVGAGVIETRRGYGYLVSDGATPGDKCD